MKKSIISIFTIILLSAVSPNSLLAQKIYYNYKDAGGDWKNKEIAHRIALMADEDGQMGFIDINVPTKGYYQIYASFLHTWDRASPRVDIIIHQNGQTRLTGYYTGEPGELSHQNEGRWLFKSFNRGELIALDKGKARVEFRLSAIRHIRKNQNSAIEKEVYLGSLLVVPGNITTGFMNILEAERAQGGWDIIEYKAEERCGILESIEGEQALLNITIPKSGTYRLIALLRNEKETEITVSFVSKKQSAPSPTTILLNSDKHWKAEHFVTGHFEAGTHNMTLRSSGSNKIRIDSVFMVPFFEEKNYVTLSCSTVYFYHNQRASNLSDALIKIKKSGFDTVDIVAYDNTFGFTEKTTDESTIRINKLLQQLKLKVSSIHIGTIPLRSADEAVTKLKWAVKLADTLGTKTIVAPPNLEIDNDAFVTQAEGFKNLMQITNTIKPLLEKHGVKLGFENHSGRQWLFQTSSDFLTARTLLSHNVYFVPDEDHFLLAGEDPVTAFTLLAPYSSFLHFKTDNDKRIQQLWGRLKTKQWSGHISLEIEQPGRALNSWFNIYNKAISY